MQHTNCNLCGADRTFPIATQNNYRAVKCVHCGLVYVNPRPSPEELLRMYNGYHQRDGKNEHAWAKLMEGNFRETSAFLCKTFPEKGNILDIGCGYGHFVQIMKNCGWSAAGIEPSSRTIAYAKQKGLNVMATTIDEAVFHDKSFDAVTAFYVLEHLFDPLSALNKIMKILKPGGMLVLRIPHTTPIVKSLDFLGIKNNLYDLPFHLYDFSPDTIKLMLEKAGFSSIRVVPGRHTSPPGYIERAVSVISGRLSRIIYSLSFSRALLPGASKTVIAVKAIV